MSKIDDQTSLGRNIRAIRESQGLTLKESARLLCVDLSLLARIERGERSVSENLLVKISQVFELDERSLRIIALGDTLQRKISGHECAQEALMLILKRINTGKH